MTQFEKFWSIQCAMIEATIADENARERLDGWTERLHGFYSMRGVQAHSLPAYPFCDFENVPDTDEQPEIELKTRTITVEERLADELAREADRRLSLRELNAM